MLSMDGERVTGAARRRRERRLRSWLKHERQTVRMVLAETFHHSSAPFPPKFREELVERQEQHAAPRGQNTARTREATYYSSKTSLAGDTAFFSLFDEEDAVWGTRPASLAEPPGPQERVPQHTVRIFGDPSLDVPALQMMNEVVEVLADVVMQPVVPQERISERTVEQIVVSELVGIRRGYSSRANFGAHCGADRRFRVAGYSSGAVFEANSGADRRFRDAGYSSCANFGATSGADRRFRGSGYSSGANFGANSGADR